MRALSGQFQIKLDKSSDHSYLIQVPNWAKSAYGNKMNDISALISIVRTETKFHDPGIKDKVFEVLKELNEDLKRGGYNAPPPTISAMEELQEYIADREEKRAVALDGKNRSRAVVKGMDDDEDEFR